MEDRLYIENLQRLNLIFEANRKVSRLLVRADAPGRMIRDICNILASAYDHAWIGLFDRNGKIDPMAVADAGNGNGAMGECLEKSCRPRCIRTAGKNGEGHVVAQSGEACAGCVLAKKAKNGEAVAMALSCKDCCYGLMVLSPPKGCAIAPQELRIIKGMADDIALGLSRMDGPGWAQALMDNALTYTAVIQDHRILYENKGLEQIHQPIVFDPPQFAAVYEGDRERIRKAYEDLAAGSLPTIQDDFQYYPHPRGEGAVATVDGLRWAMISARCISYQGKVSVLANLMDITDSREVENFLRIQDKMTSLGRITAGIAHEIRNPLSGIYIYLKAMKQNYDGDGQGCHPSSTRSNRPPTKLNPLSSGSWIFQRPAGPGSSWPISTAILMR